jgi:serine/threonine protein phosphatase PrpC
MPTKQARDNIMHEISATYTIQGGRDYQEDAVAVATSEQVGSFHLLSQEKQRLALQETVKNMQSKFSKFKVTGSTLCAAVGWIEHNENLNTKILKTSCANLGDSLAYLITINEKNEVNVKLLNQLHNPDPVINPQEYNRAWMQSGIKPALKRGSYRLSDRHYYGVEVAVSRSLGDTVYESAGLSHVPEIIFDEQPHHQDARAFILVASDGLQHLSKQEIGDIVLEINHDNFSEKTQKLVEQAERVSEDRSAERHRKAGKEKPDKTCDNITAALFMVTEKPQSAVILDGHGGAVVSNGVQPLFYPALNQNIKHAQKTAEIPVDNSEKSAAIRGVNNYLNKTSKMPDDRGEDYDNWSFMRKRRGPYSPFGSLMHLSQGAANALLVQLTAQDNSTNGLTLNILQGFFQNCTSYRDHSLSSYVLDELVATPNSMFGKVGLYASDKHQGATYKQEEVVTLVNSEDYVSNCSSPST